MIVKNSKNSRVARLIESLKSKREFNEMSPMYVKQALRLKIGVGTFSRRTEKRDYEFIGELETLNLKAYYNKTAEGIIVGDWQWNEDQQEEMFVGVFYLSESDEEYDFLPNLKNSFQIGGVNTIKERAGQGIASNAYIDLTKYYNLISDTEQYEGGRGIWERICKDRRINVYVWNGNTMDWFRDDNGKAIRFNGKNIEPNEIWGTEYEEKILLVATREEIK